MSRSRAQRLQDAMVRLLVDPALVAHVYAGGRLDGLTADDVAMLTAVDRRAWSTDRFRRARLLHAVVEELPATVAVLGIDAADAFFSSAAFAAVVAEQGSLALGFADWAAAGPVATLEGAFARARRRDLPEGAGIVCARGVVPVRVPEGTLAFVQSVRATLGANPVAALAGGARAPGPPAASGWEDWLVVGDEAGEVAVEGTSEPLVRLLIACATPRPRREVVALAGALGAGDEAEDLVDDLVAEGLLVDLRAR